MENISIEEYFNLTMLKHGFIREYRFDNHKVNTKFVAEYFNLNDKKHIYFLKSKDPNKHNLLLENNSPDKGCDHVRIYYFNGTEEKNLIRTYINPKKRYYDEFISLFKDTVYGEFTIKVEETFNHSLKTCINKLEHIFDDYVIESIKRYLNDYFKTDIDFNFINFSNNSHRKLILPYLFLYKIENKNYMELFTERRKIEFIYFKRLFTLI